MFDKIKKQIIDSGANVFRIVLYKDGVWQDEILRPSCPYINSYSVSKNFTATAIGIAQDMGLLSVEDEIIKYFQERLPDNLDEKFTRVRIRHLLTHTMGNAEGYLFENDRYTHNTDDFLGLILSKPLQYQPGEKFVYSNSTYYLLSRIIRKASGMTLEMFLRKHLFRYLGIKGFALENCPMGETMGATGMHMLTPDIAKLGVLYLNQGKYEGKQLLSEKWIEEAVKCQAPDKNYGYSFWLNDIGYSGLGAHSQTIIVVPSENLVFAAHGYLEEYDYLPIVKKAL